jgi:hypothetical protein
MGLLGALAVVVLFGMSLPAAYLRDLHEGREELVPEDPHGLDVLDLHRLRRGGHRPLPLEARATAAWTGSGRNR